MADRRSGSDLERRYLRQDPNVAFGEPFARFVEKMGFELPRDFPVWRMVEAGWTIPSVRIRVPDEYYFTWKNFPNVPRKGEVPPELGWFASMLRRPPVVSASTC